MPVAALTPEAVPSTPSRRRVAAAVTIVLVLSATALAQALGGEPGAIVGNAGLVLGFSAAGALFVRGARTLPSPERHAWTTVGTGFLIGIGGVVVIVWSIATSGDAPAFGPADLFFFTGYLIALAGFASLPHAEGSRWHRLRVALDALVGAVSLGMLAWVLLLEPIAPRLAEAPLWERTIGSLFPFLDVAVFVALMIVLVRRSSYRFDPRVVFFGIGVLFHVVGDVSYLVSAIGRTFAEASPPYLLYGIAASCYLLSASIVDRMPAPREFADRRTPVWAMVLPYTTALLMAAVLVGRVAASSLDLTDRLLVVATLVVVVLVVTRQAIAIKENRALLEEQRSVLVSSISHELRTPLTSLVGFLDLLANASSFDEDEQRELLGIVNDQALYMSRIVSDLIMLSRDGVGELGLDVARVEVSRLVDAAIAVSGIDPSSLTVEVDPPGLQAFVDRDRVEQAIVNFLVNADRYGGRHRLLRAVAEGGDLVIEVHDDGPGVPRRHELAVWDRFERGPNRYDARTPGSGIGLAIVKAVATAHGGSATYRRSEALGGACFAMRFPGRVAGPSVQQDTGAPATRRRTA